MRIEQVLYFGFILLGAGFAIAWFTNFKKRRRISKQLYEKGRYLLEEKEPLSALLVLCESNGYLESPATHNQIGLALEQIKQPELAAYAYSKARGLSSGLTKGYGSKYYVAYYYYREAYAYKDARMWEFTYLRSKAGIELIQTKQIPRYVNGVDYEVELRILRMFSCLYHLKGGEAFKIVREDAEWIINNSDNEKHKEVASCFIDLSSNVQTVARDLLDDMWERFYSPN